MPDQPNELQHKIEDQCKGQMDFFQWVEFMVPQHSILCEESARREIVGLAGLYFFRDTLIPYAHIAQRGI